MQLFIAGKVIGNVHKSMYLLWVDKKKQYLYSHRCRR